MIADLIITDILEPGGIGTFNDDLIVNFQKEIPDNQTSVYDETAQVLTESQGFSIDSTGIQVLVRDKDEATAKAKIKSAHLLIAGYRGELSDGTIVRETYITTMPTFIGSDSKNRKEFSAHYTMNFTQTATALRPQV